MGLDSHLMLECIEWSFTLVLQLLLFKPATMLRSCEKSRWFFKPTMSPKLMTHNPKREIGEKLETPLNSLPEVIWLDLVWFIAAVVGISLALHIARSLFVKRCSWKTGQCARLHFTLKHVNHGIEWIWQLNTQWKLNLTTRIKLTAYATFEIARQTACVRVTNACLWASLSGELPCGSSWQNSMEDLRISD